MMAAEKRDHALEVRNSLTDPLKLCEALGLAKGAQRQGAGVTVHCPAHKEKSPSCSVTLGRDHTIRVRCFGCSFTGDALTLIATVRGLSLRSADDFRAVLAEGAAIAGNLTLEAEILDGKARPNRERVASPVQDERTRPELDAATYAAVSDALVRLCPFTGEPDVVAYAKRRVLLVEGARAQIAGLPPKEAQGAVVAKLIEAFDVGTLQRAGLLWQYDDGRSETRWFTRPANRLVLPWRGTDGAIDVLQRRVLDASEPKYVFPTGRSPLCPFGAEVLRATDAASPLVYCEGALDVLALRLISWRDHLGLVPLGLPGVDGWRAGWAAWAKGRTAMIALDADAAGERKVAQIAEDLYAAGARDVKRFRPRGAKDWCEFLEGSVS